MPHFDNLDRAGQLVLGDADRVIITAAAVERIGGMLYRALADTVLLLHLGFVLFVALGGVLLLRWPRLAYVHLPAAVWGALIEFTGGQCPLTPLEQYLRRRGGEAGYTGGFIEHYLTAAIYPGGLTRGIQLTLGALVVLANGALYWWWWRRRGPPALRD